MSSAATPVHQRTFLGHPIGLYVLFFTEMWERFSYYGMRALLVLYMLNYYRWSQEDASKVYKWYTSLVYLTPLVGGFLADRFLGNTWAVIIGSLFMACGQFLLTVPDHSFFYAALGFMIAGNGFFKPNMSTQVGRLYPANDPRRDGAYTIFYMGINLGAFLAPLLCGWLQENTLGEFHSGFAACGLGMILGLLIYVLGKPLVIELDQNKPAEAVNPSDAQLTTSALSEQAAEEASSALPWLNRISPLVLAILGVLGLVGAPVLGPPGKSLPLGYGVIGSDTVIGFEIAAVCALISAWVTARVHRGMRDRVLTIYILGLFVVFFWAAFEQAGNAMNQWADQTTNRFLTQAAPAPQLYPPLKASVPGAEDKVQAPPARETLGRWSSMFKLKAAIKSDEQTSFAAWLDRSVNPVPTAWFQSINALAIFVMAPLFSMLWTVLARRNLSPSTPTKMAFGVFTMGSAFALMIAAAQVEDKPTSVAFAKNDLPSSMVVNAAGQLCEKSATGEAGKPYHAGRLRFDSGVQYFQMTGVLADLERDRLVGDAAPVEFKRALAELKEKSQEAKKTQEQDQTTSFLVSVPLAEVPPGFDERYTSLPAQQFRLDAAAKTMSAAVPLSDKEVKAILVAAGEPKFRDAINKLYVDSSRYRVSPWWLFGFYILSTIGELCLSPVGLSMVSKLAPARFATMLMGMWLLTSFFGNFAAGAFGEKWGTMAPADYFLIPVVALGGAALVLFLFSRKIGAMMHGVG